MEQLRARYLQGVPLAASDVPADLDLHEFVSTVVRHEVAEKFPPSVSSRRRTLRTIIDAAERRGEDVDEDLYNAYVELVSVADDRTAPSFRTVVLSHEPFAGVTTPDGGAIIAHGTTGLSLWTAGYALADLMLRDPSWVRGRHVLELGAGLGLAGMVAAHVGAADVVLTDGHDKVYEALQRSVEYNASRLPCPVRAEWLDWAEYDKATSFAADIVIGADLVFEENMVRQLVKTLAHILPSVPHGALIASTKRRDETYAFFLDLARQHSLTIVDLPVADDLGARFFCKPEAPVAIVHLTAPSAPS